MTDSVNSLDDLSESKKFQLQKEIGIWSCIGLLAGTMVGSGIFVSPAGVMQAVDGNVGYTLCLWAACGLLALLAALCYAELATKISESGADFAYHRVAYSKPFGFLYAWTSILIVRAAGNAATAYTFGIYLVGLFYRGDCTPPDSAVKLSGALLLLLLTLLNSFSVAASTKLQNVFTVAKFFVMVVIIIGGITSLVLGNPIGLQNFDNAFRTGSGDGITFAQISLGFYQGLFSYDGWNNLNYVVEEVKDCGKNIPRAIMVAVPLVTCFYVLINVAYLSVLTPAEVISSQAVAISFGIRVLGNFAWIVPVMVCLSTAGSLNGSYMTGGRMPFVAARAGQWPSMFEMVHVHFYTPIPSLVLNTFVTMIFLIPGDFDTLLSAFSFTAWTFYGMSAAAVIILRYKRKDLTPAYKVPIFIPVLVTAISIYLVIAPIVASPDLIYFYALLVMFSGFIFYYPLVKRGYVMPGSNVITKYVQLLFNSAPTDWQSEFD